MKKKLNKISEQLFSINTGSLLLLVFSLMVLDRIFFYRDLFADGSCHFLQYFYDGYIGVSIIGRIFSTAIMHLPSSIISGIGFHPNDMEISHLIYRIGYITPFFLSLYLISFLDKDYKKFGINFLIFSIVIFYLPNSMFIVGEYTVVFAFIPVFVASYINYLRFRKINSFAILSVSTFILLLTYELANFFIIFCLIILNFKILRDLKFKYGSFIKDNFHIVLLFLFSTLITIISFKTTPDWLKANGLSGITTYLIEFRSGALYDTYLLFQIIVLLLVFSICIKEKNINIYNKKNKYLFFFIVFLFTLFFLSINHDPIHSYYSKVLFLLVFFSISILIIFFKDKIKILSKTSHFFIMPATIAVCIFTLNQGLEMNKYNNKLKEIIEKMPTKRYEEVKNIQFFQSNLGKKYSWSWGHICTSVILKPNNKSVILGEFDRQFLSSQTFKKIINGKKHVKE